MSDTNNATEINLKLLKHDLSLISESLWLIKNSISKTEKSGGSSIELTSDFKELIRLLVSSSRNLTSQILPDEYDKELEKSTKKIRNLNQKIIELEGSLGLEQSPNNISCFLKRLALTIQCALREHGIQGFCDPKFTDHSLKVKVWGIGLYQYDLKYFDLYEAQKKEKINEVLKEKFLSQNDHVHSAKNHEVKLLITEKNLENICRIINESLFFDGNLSLNGVVSEEFSSSSHVLESVSLSLSCDNRTLEF